jgi:4-amino-4-deoxy-L-arabinose transferase-like glycosyltransferase
VRGHHAPRFGALRLLIAGQLVVIVAAGLFAAARVDVFSGRGFGDEPAHFDSVRMVAQQHLLPVLERDKTSEPVAALRKGRDPDTADGVERPAGLAGEQYEAFQPPLYYLVAAPVFSLSADWFRKVRLVRALGLVFVLLAAALLYDLARRATGEAHVIAFSAALSVLMWPGVLVMSVTVSNASLELLAVSALVYVLWRADSQRDSRWLMLSGVLLGLGVLTKFTVVALAPLVLFVAVRHVAEAPSRRRWAAAAATCLIPVVLLAPWVAHSLDHYGALTPNGVAREVQQPLLSPEGTDFGLGRFWAGIPDLLSGFYPLEWTLGGLSEPALLTLLFDFVKAAVFGLPLLLLVVEPARLRTRSFLLLAGPLVLGMAMIAYVTMAQDWPITLPRYLYPALPPMALFAGMSWARLLRSPRAPIAIATISALVCAVAWADAVGRYLDAG